MYPLSIGLIIDDKKIWDDLQSVLRELPVRVVMEEAGFSGDTSLIEKVERLRPDVLLIDISAAGDRLEAGVRELRSAACSPAVVALHTAAEPDAILRALRAGAAEFLYLPIGDQLRIALEKVSAEKSRVQQNSLPGGRVIGFVSGKGGCGATTLACHTAVDIAAAINGKVLIADCDMDAGMVGFLLKSKSPYTILDAIRNVNRLDPNYWNALVSNGIPRLHILSGPQAPAPLQGASAEQIRFVMRFGRTLYDWIVLDLGRSLNEFSFRAVEELDDLFIVSTFEVPALHQTKQLVKRLLDSGYGSSRLKLILNRAPKKSEISLDELEGMLGVAVYATVSNDYQSLQEAYTEGRLLAGTTALGRELNDFASRIAGLERPKKKKFSLFG